MLDDVIAPARDEEPAAVFVREAVRFVGDDAAGGFADGATMGRVPGSSPFQLVKGLVPLRPLRNFQP